jgi:hypothetical protein
MTLAHVNCRDPNPTGLSEGVVNLLNVACPVWEGLQQDRVV